MTYMVGSNSVKTSFNHEIQYYCTEESGTSQTTVTMSQEQPVSSLLLDPLSDFKMFSWETETSTANDSNGNKENKNRTKEVLLAKN